MRRLRTHCQVPILRRLLMHHRTHSRVKLHDIWHAFNRTWTSCLLSFPSHKNSTTYFCTDVFPQAIISRTSTSNNMVQNRKKISGSIKNNYIVSWKQASPSCGLFFSWSGDTHDDGEQFNYSLFAMRTFGIILLLLFFHWSSISWLQFLVPWYHPYLQGKNPQIYCSSQFRKKNYIYKRVSSP